MEQDTLTGKIPAPEDASGGQPGSTPVEVSIIVPAYNEVESVEPLLEELAAKLGPEYEVVIVDDGSHDGTYEEACRLKEQYPFLTVVRHGRNRGKTAAILTGGAASQ